MTIGPETEPIETLLAHGRRMKLRAPELAVAFGERAASLAEASGSEDLWAEAEGVAVFARARLGERASVAGRALTALRTAEVAGQTGLALAMRTELALCARSVGAPMTGLAALRPALEHRELAGATRAAALGQLVGCLSHLGRRTVLDQALHAASEAIDADDDMDDADKATAHAMVHAATAAHCRRHGDGEAAMAAARQGLDLVNRGDDGAQVRIRLGLELVSVLLDTGRTMHARELAGDLLDAPVRAAGVGPAAWLRLAIATRVVLPESGGEAAGRMVRDALYSAERHGHDGLAARLWLELSGIEERLGRPAEALACVQASRQAEFNRVRRRRQALSLLTGAFGRGEQVVDPAQVLAGTGQAAGVGRDPVSDNAESDVDGRHGAHGHRTVPARSVLERMGITPGQGGRRRRSEPPVQRRHLRAVAETAGSSEPHSTGATAIGEH